MTKRLSKKIPREWTRADIGERPRPRYRRDQLRAALDYQSGIWRSTTPRHALPPWKYGRKRK